MRKIEFSGKISKVERPSYQYRVANSGTQKMVYSFDLKHMPKIDPNDYVFCRVRACSADVPNRNGDCFPYDELKKSYVTFLGRGVYQDHKADSVSDMRGLILDAAWKEDAEHGAWVELLLAVDKSYEDLCRKILKGQITDVSMGCMVREGICSVCGNVCRGEVDDWGNDDICEHIARFKGREFNGQPVYEMCRGVDFIEISFVTDGADVEAVVLDNNIVPTEELPETVAQYLSTANLPQKDRRVASHQIAEECSYANTLVRELPEQYSQLIFDMCTKASPENYWNEFGSIQEYTLRRAVYHLKQLGATRVLDINTMAIKKLKIASQELILTEEHAPEIQSLLEEYLQNYASNYKDPSLPGEAVAYALGKFQDDISTESGQPIGIYDVGGLASGIVQDLIEAKILAFADRKDRKRRRSAGAKVTNLSKLKPNQAVTVTDSEYGFTADIATVHSSLAVSPGIDDVEWVELLVEIGDGLKIAKIYQADIDEGVSEIHLA